MNLTRAALCGPAGNRNGRRCWHLPLWASVRGATDWVSSAENGGAHEANEPAIDRRTYRCCVCPSSNSSSGAAVVRLGSGGQIGYGGLQRGDSATLSGTESRNGSGLPAEQRRQAHTSLQGRRREGRESCSQPLTGLR